MTIITFLSPAGGTGRTTAVMALTCAFLEKVGTRPLVIDASQEMMTDRGETASRKWRRVMWRGGFKKARLGYQRVDTIDQLEDAVATGLRTGHSPILIDTTGRLTDLSTAAAQSADIIISPFTDALTAHRVSEALDCLDLQSPVYGLKCGNSCYAEHEDAVLAAFRAGRLFQNGLLEDDLLACISIDGHLPATFDRLANDFQSGRTGMSHELMARSCDAIDGIRKLADEIQLALEGYELRKRTPMPRRHPLALHKLGQLLPA